MEKPTLPKGTRDFGPAVMARRQYIFGHIRTVFQRFGFLPLETPAMENLSTLTGKYGEEGDQLLFKVLNSGEFLRSLKKGLEELSSDIIRDLYDGVLGISNRNEKSAIIELVEQNIKDLSPSKRALFEDIKEDLIDSIWEWANQPYEGDNGLERLKNLLQQRNVSVAVLLSKVKENLAKEYISEKGLRYDLTVPFARYVVMNKHEIAFPFKRYQIQPVWRADRPQKGRYREFYQCDADVVGTRSLLCEAEIILMIKDVFARLAIIDYTIKINHRGILSGIADVIGAAGQETALFVAIDKLDKIGEDGVRNELLQKGFPEQNLKLLFDILHVKGSTTNKLAFLATKFETIAEGRRGLRDLKEVFNLVADYGSNDHHVEFDVSLARGLSYYTGCIFEVKINNVSIGSVSGGGRYDNLTQTFGDKENLSGVGFSFGVDRIYDAMDELNLFPKETQVSSQVLIGHFDEASQRYGLRVLTALRTAGISAEIYPDLAKIKKQLDYANKKLVPYTIVIGDNEMASGQLAFKAMETGIQESLTVEQIIGRLTA